MMRFTLAALLALPFLAIGTTKAMAGHCKGCCSTPTLNLGFGIRIGAHSWCFCEKAKFNPCLPGKSCHKKCCHGCGHHGGGYGGGHGGGYGGGYGCSMCGCSDPSCSLGAGAPWYLFWPYNAHFQTPAPTGYPYWPNPQTISPNFNPYSFPAGGVKAAGYYPQMPVGYGAQVPVSYRPQAPAYWYGK